MGRKYFIVCCCCVSCYLNVFAQITQSACFRWFGETYKITPKEQKWGIKFRKILDSSTLFHLISRKCTRTSPSLHERQNESKIDADDINLCPIYYKSHIELQDLFSMCHIPGCGCGVLVEPVVGCVSAGEDIGAGPHISAFYSIHFPHSISENAFWHLK